MNVIINSDETADIDVLFLLKQTCQRKAANTLEEIDGLLGCPLALFPESFIKVRKANSDTFCI